MATEIRDAAQGTCLVHIDGPVLRAGAAGPRVAYVAEPDVLDAPAGRRLLHLDGDDVRRAPGEARVACWEDGALRRAPSWPALCVVEGAAVQEPSGAARFVIAGDAPSRAQLTAALHHIDPALFQPSPDEEAQLGARFEIDEPLPVLDGAWRAAAGELGTFEIRSRPAAPWVAVRHAAADGRTWSGVGARNVRLERLEIVVAMAPDASAELGLLLDGDGDGPTMAWLPAPVVDGRDDLTREGLAGGFEGSLAPHPKGADEGREALVAPGGIPAWRFGGKELFAGSADAQVRLWHMTLDGDRLAGDYITGDGAFGLTVLERG